MPASTKERITPGPAMPMPSPMTTKMPVPMTAPTPSAVRSERADGALELPSPSPAWPASAMRRPVSLTAHGPEVLRDATAIALPFRMSGSRQARRPREPRANATPPAGPG